MKKTLLAISTLALLTTGCSSRLADLTIVSTKNVSEQQLIDSKTQVKRSIGEDIMHIIVFIPTGVANMEEAMDNAIESVPCGIALKDATITHKSFYIPYIYGQSGYEVEGNVVQDNKCLVENNISTTVDEKAVVDMDTAITPWEYKGVNRNSFGIMCQYKNTETGKTKSVKRKRNSACPKVYLPE
ncbi:hypothetical protein [Colwellia piezophila]|uniref:hypothetical protein n=1 Tax=Colwellia piezophila TaxID=211668 RepID=UPI0003738178|nr:hypothetical protein [Colwellia piezophila]